MQTFNYHTHTYRCKHSDENYCDEGYVIDFLRAGFTDMAFTDHIPRENDYDMGPNMRMSCSEIDGYLESIAALKTKYRGIIEIGSGYEAEFIPGEVGFLNERKSESDKFILGQHFVYDSAGEKIFLLSPNGVSDDSIERYADAIENAVALGLPDIIAHPDLYAAARGGFGKTDEKVARRICAAAAKADIPLEINLHRVYAITFRNNKVSNNAPAEIQRERLRDAKVCYPVRDFWEIAAEYPVKVIYGVDAHHMGEIAVWRDSLSLTNELLGDELIGKLNFIVTPF